MIITRARETSNGGGYVVREKSRGKLLDNTSRILAYEGIFLLVTQAYSYTNHAQSWVSGLKG